ncbi:MAG: LysR family transcriptional regulator [Thiolinea sp.]
MNLKQLRAFQEVMLSGSVSEAARRLSRSQPAVSALINALETEIGFKLFIRKDMRLQPVPEAHYLLREATQILNHLDTTRMTMQGIRKLEKGALRIASMPGPSVILLPHFLENFLNTQRGIKTSLISKTSPQVARLVAAQQYDIGVADYKLIDQHDDSLIQHQCFELRCVCALPAKHPLAEKAFITPQDLDSKPMVSLLSDHPLTSDIQEIFADCGAHFNVVFEAQYFIPLFTFIERGNAFGIVDQSSAESYHLLKQPGKNNIVFRPFSPTVSLTTTLMTPAHNPMSALAAEFYDTLKQHFSDMATSTLPHDEEH